MLRDVYLESGWLSVLAWIGTVITLAAAIGIVVAVLDTRTPHGPRPARTRHRRQSVSRVSLISELVVRLAHALAVRVLRLDRREAGR